MKDKHNTGCPCDECHIKRLQNIVKEQGEKLEEQRELLRRAWTWSDARLDNTFREAYEKIMEAE